jgi:hypothetical protein
MALTPNKREKRENRVSQLPICLFRETSHRAEERAAAIFHAITRQAQTLANLGSELKYNKKYEQSMKVEALIHHRAKNGVKNK